MSDEKDLLIDALHKENEQLRVLVSELHEKNSELEQTIKDLREQLNKNSATVPSRIPPIVSKSRSIRNAVPDRKAVQSRAVSVNRIHEILSGVFNIPISTGTIINMVSRFAKKIEPIYYKIGEKLKSSPIGHADGTGTSINGTTECPIPFT